MHNKEFTIVIIGSPNVGKSSLFNYLLGKNISTVSDATLTTRDRNYGLFKFSGKKLQLIDTGSLLIPYQRNIQKKIFLQSCLAIKESSAVFVVIDNHNSCDNDLKVIKFCQTFCKDIQIVINKVDKKQSFFIKNIKKQTPSLNTIDVSIHQGKGINTLLKHINNIFNHSLSRSKNEIHPAKSMSNVRVSIIGRSNVGKSTFLNTLYKNKRHITDNTYFTTTDPVLTEYVHERIRIIFTDTAGIVNNIKNNFEAVFVKFSLNTIKISDIVIFMTDIHGSILKEDKKIIAYIVKSYRPVIVVINKIDLLKDKKGFIKFLKQKYLTLLNVKIHFISSLNHNDVINIIFKVVNIYKLQLKRISISIFNNMLLRIITKKRHPLINNKSLKVYFGKQLSSIPLSFIIVTNMFAYQIKRTYLQYIKNKIVEAFNLKDIPVKLILIKKDVV